MKASTKKRIFIMLGVFIFIPIVTFVLCKRYNISPQDVYTTEYKVKTHARRAAVETCFYHPVMKATFVEPIAEEEVKKPLTKKEIRELVDEQVEAANAKREEEFVADTDKYKGSLTDIDEWGELGESRTFIPLGAFAPDWARFPQKVLVAYKTEKKEITAWEKEYEKDVLIISELANISPTAAKATIVTLRASGYSLTKTDIDKTSEVTLLHYRGGWDNSYPETLNWKVSYAGEEANLIVGYDIRGILEVKPLADDKIIHIEAGYYDLMDQYKPKSNDMLRLEMDKERLETEAEAKDKRIQELLDEAWEKEKKEYPKRDISQVTWLDVIGGTVKIEQFWMISGGTGVFLGNTQVKKDISGWDGRSYGWYGHDLRGKNKGVVMTNAHVAMSAMKFSVEVTEDLEEMWIMYPGIPFVRYTQNSDMMGSPAELLYYDQEPVMTMDFDVALLVTSQVPAYEKHRALLGNSSQVRNGDKVIMVGNPALNQKFMTEGIVSNVSYSALNSKAADWWLYEGIPRGVYNWILNSNFWIDTPIGTGGTSGSAVWAMQGSEKGKVVALHNMGLVTSTSVANRFPFDEKGKGLNVKGLGIDADVSTLFSIVAKENGKKMFANYSYKDAKFSMNMDKFKEKEPGIEITELCGGRVDISGMNGAIPIDKVKQYLQERGIDPDQFGWKELSDEYWEK